MSRNYHASKKFSNYQRLRGAGMEKPGPGVDPSSPSSLFSQPVVSESRLARAQRAQQADNLRRVSMARARANAAARGVASENSLRRASMARARAKAARGVASEDSLSLIRESMARAQAKHRPMLELGRPRSRSGGRPKKRCMTGTWKEVRKKISLLAHNGEAPRSIQWNGTKYRVSSGGKITRFGTKKKKSSRKKKKKKSKKRSSRKKKKRKRSSCNKKHKSCGSCRKAGCTWRSRSQKYNIKAHCRKSPRKRR
jgi:hypothetical protein